MASQFTIPLNKVLDYNVLQGVSHPSDLSTRIIRDINYRYITIENSSDEKTVGIAITNSMMTNHTPPIAFRLAPGEIRHLAVNSPGLSVIQAIHMIDPVNGQFLGDPSVIQSPNSYVIRHGLNKFWIQGFTRPSYRAAF